MNFSDIELKLRYPEAFRDNDSLNPPTGVALPKRVRKPRVSWSGGLMRIWSLLSA